MKEKAYRSLVTICVFMEKGMVDNSLKYHLISAKNNGITKTEMAEIITHAAFYAGWPNAWAVFNMAKEIIIGIFIMLQKVVDKY